LQGCDTCNRFVTVYSWKFNIILSSYVSPVKRKASNSCVNTRRLTLFVVVVEKCSKNFFSSIYMQFCIKLSNIHYKWGNDSVF
jgi:hypothetical protein